MRIIRYLKNCKVAVLLIVCLLVVQAFTDLALPHMCIRDRPKRV